MEELYAQYLDSSGLCTDTRKITKDCFFVCLSGAQFNGNTFAKEALEKGAKTVVVDDENYFESGKSMLLVPDSLKFVQDLARHHRRQFSIPIIGITGSNGKTTSKELIHAVLSKKYKTLATEGNLNNHLGVPFTLLRLDKTHQIAVIEMGANKPGDIKELCDIAEPDFGIITNIGKAHLEGFGGFDGVLNTKTELYRSIAEHHGSIIVNGDDEVLMNNLPETVSYIYGKEKDRFVFGELIEMTPFVKMSWSHKTYESHPLSTKLVGEYNFYNFLAAACFGKLFDVDNEAISEALENYTPTNNRSQVKESDSNTLILDCYNANPSSMELALRSFAQNTLNKKKIAIVGAMKELGEAEKEEHERILKLLNELDLSAITVGKEFSNSLFPHFSDVEQLMSYLGENPIKDSLILLKGSRSIGLEKLEDIL